MKLLNDKNKFYPIGESLVAQLNITKSANVILESHSLGDNSFNVN